MIIFNLQLTDIQVQSERNDRFTGLCFLSHLAERNHFE